MNDLVGKILSVAQEKDCDNRDHNKAGERRRRGFFDCRRGVLNVRAMTLEENSDLVGLFIGPTKVGSEVFGNFSRGDSVRQGGNCREKLTAIFAKLRKKTVREKHREDDQSEIGFQDVRASEVLEKERGSLQESHDRIDKICEQDRKVKNGDYRPRHVAKGKSNPQRKHCPSNT